MKKLMKSQYADDLLEYTQLQIDRMTEALLDCPPELSEAYKVSLKWKKKEMQELIDMTKDYEDVRVMGDNE